MSDLTLFSFFRSAAESGLVYFDVATEKAVIRIQNSSSSIK